MEFALALKEEFETLTCGNCGIVFAVFSSWKKRRVEGEGGNRSFYCPNGHARVFTGETSEQRLQRELDVALSAKRFAESRLADEQKRHKHELNRIHKRAHAGVCQYCHRTFQNVARHMKTKHAEVTQ